VAGLALLLSALLIAFTADAGAASNHFDPGYCTWDAAEQAHSAWGIFPPWYGDAGDWIDAARASGWDVSSTPEAHSIVAMPRGVQGSGSLGHVGWVIAIEDDGVTVEVRSMNWNGRGQVTVHELVADGQIQFLTPPGGREITLTTKP
jgi:surface antigen